MNFVGGKEALTFPNSLNSPASPFSWSWSLSSWLEHEDGESQWPHRVAENSRTHASRTGNRTPPPPVPMGTACRRRGRPPRPPDAGGHRSTAPMGGGVCLVMPCTRGRIGFLGRKMADPFSRCFSGFFRDQFPQQLLLLSKDNCLL